MSAKKGLLGYQLKFITNQRTVAWKKRFDYVKDILNSPGCPNCVARPACKTLRDDHEQLILKLYQVAIINRMDVLEKFNIYGYRIVKVKKQVLMGFVVGEDHYLFSKMFPIRLFKEEYMPVYGYYDEGSRSYFSEQLKADTSLQAFLLRPKKEGLRQ